jgi:serine/threonine protein kinase
VAIKKIEKAFEHAIFTKRTLRELKILRLLAHENVIVLSDMFRSLALRRFKNPNPKKNSMICRCS